MTSNNHESPWFHQQLLERPGMIALAVKLEQGPWSIVSQDKESM